MPHVGEWAEHLYVFQRTPSSIDVKNSPPTDPEWAKSLRPGWHQERMDNFNNLVSGVPQAVDLVKDGWTDLIGKLLLGIRQGRSKDLTPEGLARAVELADFEKMEEIRARVDADGEGSRDRRGAQAVLPAVLQAAVRPQRVSRDVQPPERDARRHRRAAASSASPRRASSSTAASTRSTA